MSVSRETWNCFLVEQVSRGTLFSEIIFQVEIFFFPDLLFLGNRLIPIAAEMKDAMENDPVQFGFKGQGQGFRIFLNPVDTDINFSYRGTGFSKIKTDNICIEIMTEVLFINFQQSFVSTEYIIK